MVDISSGDKKINITVSSTGNKGNVSTNPDMSMFYTERSKEWAISDKIVNNEDYSSKYYAQKSKEQAQISTEKTEEVVNSGNKALSNIDNAKNNAIIDLTNQETLSIDNIKTEGAKQVTLATNQANIATEKANIATTQAGIATAKTTEVVESGNTALSNIATAKSNALSEINATGSGYVENAEQYAQNALTSANNAALSESNALSYKNSIQESAQIATEQANIAVTNANKAITSATNAKTSETNAKSSEVRCEEILSKLGTAIKIKGRVDSLGDLPLGDNLDGDAYLVGEEGLDSYPEYYWYQDHWEFLGTSGGGGTWGTITGDITAQSDLIEKLDTKQDTLTSENAGSNILISSDVKNLCSGVFGVMTNFSKPIPAGTVLSFSASSNGWTTTNRLRVRFYAEDGRAITNFYPILNSVTNRIEMKNLKYTSDVYSYLLTDANVGEYQLEKGPECTEYEPYQEEEGGGILKISAIVPTRTSQLLNDDGFITSSYHDSTKQDVISDLATIREGASKGATALQVETDPIYMADKPNIAKVDLSNLTEEGIKVIKDNSGAGLQMFDTVLKDHVLTFEKSKGLALQGTYVYKTGVSGSRYGYPDFYNKCVEEFGESVNTETVNGVTVKVHSNGHKFYDIADKSAIDEFFNSMGSAWFYGVDTANERIFLPRNNNFVQITSNTSDVNSFVEAGLPNIEGSVSTSGVGAAYQSPSGAFKSAIGSYGAIGNFSGSWSLAKTLTLNASNSSKVYGNSDTVQPAAVKQLLYICVGNTEVTSSITNVTEITTSENDTIPLGCSRYSGEILSPSAGWLKSSGQWNSGDLYTSFYNMAVSKIGQPFASGTIVENTSAYTDYDLVVNQTDMTFRLPLLDGSEDLLSDKYEDLELLASGSTYIAPANGWYQCACTGTAGSTFFELVTFTVSSTASFVGGWARTSIPVKKGDVVTVYYGGTNFVKKIFRFTYAQGNGTLYFKVANAVQNLELLNVGEVMEAVNNVVPNNSSLISSYAMPSNKYIELTLGASGATYTAPADGYVQLSANAATQIDLINVTTGIRTGGTYTNNTYRYAYIPVRQNDVFGAWYTISSLDNFRFIYAEGAKND